MLEKGCFKLTNPQKSIWNMGNFYSESTICNVCTVGFIHDAVNTKSIIQAINNVVKKNDTFRIILSTKDGIPIQRIVDYEPFDVEIINVKSNLELEKLEKKLASERIDFFDSRLYKFKLASFKNGDVAIILVVNHIIADSWALGLVIQEILEEYNAITNHVPLDILRPSYTNYIESEQTYKNSNRFEKDKLFWETVFSNVPNAATIPSNKKVISSISSEAKRISFLLDKSWTDKIIVLSKSYNTSIFNFLFSIYSIYLSRVSSLDDFVIGTPILNRSTSLEKNTMGMFVNTIPVRITISDDDNFSNFIHSLSTNILGALKHQKYSYTQILEDLRFHDNNISNLYNVLISYQITKAYNSNLGNYETKWIFNNCCENDLNIHITDINDTGTLHVSYDYKTSKYDAQDITDIHERICHVINQISESSSEELSIKDISIATKEEEKMLIYTNNSTEANYPKDKTVVDLFELQVLNNPQNIAVSYNSESLTYAELDEKVNKFANFLKSSGIKKSDMVSILQTKTPNLLISILAVLKLGACYVPIDPAYPEERIKTIIHDSNSKLLITNQSIDFKNKINIEEFDYERADKTVIKNCSKPKDLAYVIFTSGSTGKPKGVAIEHNSLLNYIYWASKFYCNFKPTNFPLYTSISFDLTVTSIFTPLINGGTVVVYKEGDIYDTLDKIFSDNVSDVVKLTPAHLTLVNELKFSETRAGKLIVGGDVLSTELCKKITDKFKNIRIFNEYGPTEATVGCMIYEYTEESNAFNAVLIGKPIDNTQIYILDNNLHIQPAGIEGEIYIAGDGLARCYLNDPEKTKNSFIHSPFEKGKLMYKTGDSGICYKDGNMNCFGRLDNQIKLRGQRIELAEIENKMDEIDGIDLSVVIKKSDSNSSEYLVAYYVSSKNITGSQIKAELSKFLPLYMIPSYYIKLSEMLYTTNGKIDRKKLALIEVTNEDKNIVPPRNQTDKQLIEILNDILGNKEISIDDNFFSIGGDSLSAISLCIRIQDVFNIKLSVKELLDNSTISEISDIISSYKNHSNDDIITRASIKSEYTVSTAQKMIYFASKVAGNDSILYNTPGGIIINGQVDSIKLQQCIETLISRHESLRTYFESDGEKVVQKVLNKTSFKLNVFGNADIQKIDNYFKDFVKPFDLSKAPLLRATLISFSDGNSALFIDMHHIISDGTSLSIFTEELCRLYNDETLDNIDITYKDFAEYENGKFDAGKMKNVEDYWINKFKDDIPALNIQTPKPRPAIQNYEGKKKYFILDETMTQKLSDFCKKNKVTPSMLLLTCYFVLLSKYTSQDDIIIGLPAAGRTKKQTEKVLGMFVNTLPLRAKIDKNISIRNLLFIVKHELIESLENQEYPFDELVNKLGISRDTSRNPLFDTMFIFQNDGLKEIKFAGLETKYYIPDTHISKFDLSLEVIPQNNKLNFSFEYSTSLFNSEFINNLSEHYINIINRVLEDDQLKIDDIDMLSVEEKNKVLYGFNETQKDYPSSKTLVELFEEQAKKTPNNIAVVFGDAELSYKELNKKADCLAGYLQKNNRIQPNDLVGIMVNRSIEMIVSIIAVLKAGGAYIPIDPNFPKDRISYMLNGSNAKVLLTQKALEYTIDFPNKICVDLDEHNIYSSKRRYLKNTCTPEDLAYVIFTSGSTGVPKGVMLKHKNIVNFIYGMMNIFNFSSNDTIASITTISFDIFVLESLLPLLNGLKIVIASEDEQLNVNLFNNLCIKNNCSVIQTTPSRIQTFMSSPDELNFIRNAKYILIGGEPFPKLLLPKIRTLTNARIFNMYGPTETAVWSSVKELKSDEITIGKPISNTQIYVLDSNLHPQPIGVPGELYISGDGVSAGYLNNFKKTEESFIENPFIPGTIMYKTGDTGFFKSTGELVCLGRADNQIKIRGLRIELEEIESAILKYPYIKNVCVVKKNINDREFIIAYLILNKRIVINEFRNYLANWLPRYMIPTYYVFLDDFPYTPNGKIDKSSLPLPEKVLNFEKETFTPPSTTLQKKIAEIWERILNIKPIGINDNFFELGGDSLLAMNLNLELTTLSNKITYQDIFRYPTIVELETKINSNNNKPLFEKIENIPGDVEDVLKKSRKANRIKKNINQNVLLTGATGFLGIHILEQFLHNNKSSKVYCLIRKEPGISIKTKLIQKLNYYFGNKYDNLVGVRIIPITGDITRENFGMTNKKISEISNSIDIIINSAANVSHFGNYKDFYVPNVVGVKNIINFCKKYNKKFYHISTTSVSGEKWDMTSIQTKKTKTSKILFDESSLYIGQKLENVYAHSKFDAECILLDEISKGLDAYIFRMGNLMPRFTDGIFQDNENSNAFMNRIKSFIELDMIPNYILSKPLEFTPVDLASNAVYRLIKYSNDTNRVFHIYNPHYVPLNRFLHILRKEGYNIKVVTEKEFKNKINQSLHSLEQKDHLNNLLNDLTNDLHLDYKIDIILKSDITRKLLRKTYFIWPRISTKYLKKFVRILK